jgi:serine O-acetyltransferase
MEASRLQPLSFPQTAEARALYRENLAAVVEALCGPRFGQVHDDKWNRCIQPLPESEKVIELVEDLRSVLFPGYYGNSRLTPDSINFHVGATLDKVLGQLEEQVRRGLCFSCPKDGPQCDELERKALDVVRQFLAYLPRVQAMLMHDVEAAYDGDPAVHSKDEVIFSYPGLIAITNYRIAHELHLLDIPLIPRMITEYAHRITGIDIHPGARIGKYFFIDHGTGVVIGETTRIGERVRLYQGVTLGAKSFPLDEHGNPIKGIDRHPIIEDDVIIYSGATILGRVTIGKGSVIGGNVWLTKGVPPGTRVAQVEVKQEIYGEGSGI